MIDRLELQNFTAFSDLVLDFSPKINIIIGENGTGKTHLLKAAYGFCAAASLFKNKPNSSKDELETLLTEQMLRLFMPLDHKLGRMHRQDSTEQAYLAVSFARGQKTATSFSKNSKSLSVQEHINYEQEQIEAVFIPTKEVLSFMKGFSSLYGKYDLSFDQTYRDICLLLDLPEARPENLHEKSKWAIKEMERICGGRFIFYGGGKITFKTETTEHSANLMAEGFRKLGILARLLETAALQPGICGPLFWDEPESNLNPKLMEKLVQILIELSRNGQQIILATHDYVLFKWFDLLMDKNKNDHVRFHTLYQDANTKGVKVSSTDDYREIKENPIAEAFNNLTIAHAKLRLKGAFNE